MPSLEALLAVAYEQRVALAVASVLGLVLFVLVAWRAGWIGALRRRPRIAAGLTVGALVVGLPLAWYLASPLFIRTELVEPPVAVAGERSADPVATPATPATPGPAATAAPVATPAPVLRSGEFAGADEFHFGSGKASLIETAPGEWSIRFEDFSVRNGPDLFVYLSPDPDGYADGAVEVARLRATDGSFNTPVPAGIDPSRFGSVLIWCKQFSTLFAVAGLDA